MTFSPAPGDAVEKLRISALQPDQGVATVLAWNEHRVSTVAKRAVCLPQMARGEGRAIGTEKQRPRVSGEHRLKGCEHARAEITAGLRRQGDGKMPGTEAKEGVVDVGRAMKLDPAERCSARRLQCLLDELGMERRGSLRPKHRNEAGLDRPGARGPGENDDCGFVRSCHSALRDCADPPRASKRAEGAT